MMCSVPDVLGVQSPRWSTHPIKSKCCLFASFWSINHLFVSFSSPTIAIWIWKFPSDCTAGRPIATGVQNSLKVMLSYWSKKSKLISARVWSCHLEPCRLGDSPRQEYDNDNMPEFLQHSCLGTSKTWYGSGSQDHTHDTYYELLRKKYYRGKNGNNYLPNNFRCL